MSALCGINNPNPAATDSSRKESCNVTWGKSPLLTGRIRRAQRVTLQPTRLWSILALVEYYKFGYTCRFEALSHSNTDWQQCIETCHVGIEQQIANWWLLTGLYQSRLHTQAYDFRKYHIFDTADEYQVLQFWGQIWHSSSSQRIFMLARLMLNFLQHLCPATWAGPVQATTKAMHTTSYSKMYCPWCRRLNTACRQSKPPQAYLQGKCPASAPYHAHEAVQCLQM